MSGVFQSVGFELVLVALVPFAITATAVIVRNPRRAAFLHSEGVASALSLFLSLTFGATWALAMRGMLAAHMSLGEAGLIPLGVTIAAGVAAWAVMRVKLRGLDTAGTPLPPAGMPAH